MKHIIIFILSITAPQDQISLVLCLKISSEWNQHKQYFSLPFPWLPQKMLIWFCSFFHFFFFFICGRNFTFGFCICFLDSFLWHTAQEMSLPCVSGCLSVWKTKQNKINIFLIFTINDFYLYPGLSLTHKYLHTVLTSTEMNTYTFPFIVFKASIAIFSIEYTWRICGNACILIN